MIKNIRELEEYLNISNDPPEGSQECFNELIDKLEKQQKEIEVLKLVHETYKEEIESIEDRYISKDKIRDKIKELEKKNGYCIDLYSGKQIKSEQDYQIEVLKQLLKEK